MRSIHSDEYTMDEDARRDAIDERRDRSNTNWCQCGDDLPGRCPGATACPYADVGEAE